ncbi:MAG: hypothetical protein HY460_00435 [Parcubacteria group bacterium]|nr:hypothetical protein [Parcubacteria group bacterium]
MQTPDALTSFRERPLESLLSMTFNRKEFNVPADVYRRLRAIGITSVGELYKLINLELRDHEAPAGIGRKTLGFAKRLCTDLNLFNRIHGHYDIYRAVANEARTDERLSAELTKEDFDSWRDGLRTELYRRTQREIGFATQYVTVSWLKDSLLSSLADDARKSPRYTTLNETLFGPRVFEGSSVSFDAEVSLTEHDFHLASAKTTLAFRNDVLALALKQWQGNSVQEQKIICSIFVNPKVIERAEVKFWFHPTEPLRGHISIGPTVDDMNKLIEAARPKKVVPASRPDS